MSYNPETETYSANSVDPTRYCPVCGAWLTSRHSCSRRILACIDVAHRRDDDEIAATHYARRKTYGQRLRDGFEAIDGVLNN